MWCGKEKQSKVSDREEAGGRKWGGGVDTNTLQACVKFSNDRKETIS